jgi:hypothetical protein
MNTPQDQWLAELDQVEAEVRRELQPLSEAQFAWKPAANRWSIGECLDHLGITAGLMLGKVRPAIEHSLNKSREDDPSAPYRYGMVGGWFVRSMEKPGKRPSPSPRNFQPSARVTRTRAMESFTSAHRDLRVAIEKSRGLALDRIKAPSSAKGAGWLRLNVAAWLAAALAHARRHVAQAQRVRRSPGFPSA